MVRMDAEEDENKYVDHKVLSHPPLRMQQIVERGCSATMVDLQATFSNASDWLHVQKAKLKEVIREASGNRAVPRTPRRGLTFKQFRETAESYSRSILTFEDDVEEEVLHRGEGDAAQADEITSTPVAVVQEACITDQIETPAVMDSPRSQGNEMMSKPKLLMKMLRAPSMEEKTSQKTETKDRNVCSITQIELESPAVTASPIPVRSQSNAAEAVVTNLHVKQEILSSQRTLPSLDTPCTASTETCERITRSVAKTNAAIYAVSFKPVLGLKMVVEN
ncbi:hypothetical protein OSTOST_10074 [Ostertagia ostertagi]